MARACRRELISRRSYDIRPDTHAQLIAAAGLTADEARAMTLTQVVFTKMNRESTRD